MNRNVRLPESIIDEARAMLRHADRVYVIRWNRRYKVVESLRGYEHAHDEALVAELRDYDFYTDEQRAENYINDRHQYPEWYMGKRDYDLLRRLDDDIDFDPKTGTLTVPVGRIVNGDFVWTGERQAYSEG